MEKREQLVIRTSIVGIVVNIALAIFKAVIGALSHSVAITTDAVNNLSDALSSLITILGTKLAARAPDKKHPLGYGRVEYLSATIIAFIVLYAGVEALVESIKKIVTPQVPDYSSAALILIGVGVAVKVLLGGFFLKRGAQTNSEALSNSGRDARNDAILSATTLAAALLYVMTGLSLEAWLGVLISLVVLKSGMEMLRDTVSEILGERVDPQLARQIKDIACSFPEVQGAYDLTVSAYGPGKWIASLHIETADTMTAEKLDSLTRQMTAQVLDQTGVILTGVSVYAVNTQDPEVIEIRRKVRALAFENPYVLEMHGFYLDKENKMMRLDLVFSFAAPDRTEECRRVQEALTQAFPAYQVFIQPDVDISD
jgi:cation diffusion facilitator family transporter